MAPDAAELMHAAVGADVHPIVDGHVAGERHAVAQNDVIADAAIVRHVGVGHQQVVAADAGDQAAARGAAVDGDELADAVAVADARLGALAFIFQILRGHADGAVREEDVVFADPGGAFQVDVGHQAGAGADLHFRADDAVGSDLGAFGDARLRVHDGGRMDGHR